jgi:RNA polymerase sigma-70 factor, ECF subfamily
MVSAPKMLAVGELVEEPTKEAALVRAGRAGDPAALEQLLGLHKRAVYALCRSILGHADDAEDAVQETFLRALRGLRGFRGDASFRTWILRIAVNVCRDWTAARRPSEPWEERHVPSSGPGASPEAIALRQMGISEALSRLMPRHRTLLILKVREGWSVAEIAQAMGWSEKRVENELSRARRALAVWRRDVDGGDEP